MFRNLAALLFAYTIQFYRMIQNNAERDFEK